MQNKPQNYRMERLNSQEWYVHYIKIILLLYIKEMLMIHFLLYLDLHYLLPQQQLFGTVQDIQTLHYIQ